MDISDNNRKHIADEIEIAVNMMKESRDASEKLYYFSAIYGILQRIYNIEYDEDLVFAHLVIQLTHQGFMQRLAAIKQGDSTVMISEEQFDKLTDLSDELGDKIRDNEDFVATLKKIVILLYSTQGNGYYLMKKGVLKI